MFNGFTLGKLPEESLAFFKTYASELCKTPRGRKELLEAAMLFCARLLYQKSKTESVKEWIRQLDSWPTEDTVFATSVAVLLVQMQGLSTYLESYTLKRLLEIDIHVHLIKSLRLKGPLTLAHLSNDIGFSQRNATGFVNNLLDARLLEYSGDNKFCLSAEGERVAKVL